MDRPVSLINAIRMMLVLIALAVATTILTAVRRDDLLLAWAHGNAGGRKLLEEGGLEAVKASPLAPSFVPLMIVATVVFTLLLAVLLPFFYEGHGWARLLIAGTALFGGVLSMLIVARGIPTLFVVMSVLAALGCAVLLVLLFLPATNRFFRWS